MDDYTVPFPNIVAFPPGLNFMDLSVTVIDRETRCEFEDEVRVYRYPEPSIENLGLIRYDFCSAKITAKFWRTVPLELLSYGLFSNETQQFIPGGVLEIHPNDPNQYIVSYHFGEETQFLEANSSYTFFLGIHEEALEGIDKYGCNDSKNVWVGNLSFYGDFAPINIPPDLYPTEDTLQEWIVTAPDTFHYNATYYELRIFDGDNNNGEIYNKIEELKPGEIFSFDQIRWDGKIRFCWSGAKCYTEVPGASGPEDNNGQCTTNGGSGSNPPQIKCNDSYWSENDGYNVCFDACGYPRFHRSGLYAYYLLLKNCNNEQLFEGGIHLIK